MYNLEASFKEYLVAVNSKATVKNYLSDLRHFFTWLQFSLKTEPQTVNLTEIDIESILDYKNYLAENNLPLKTINRRLSSLRRFFSFCISQGWLMENPAKQVKNILKSQIEVEETEPIVEETEKKSLINLPQLSIKHYVSLSLLILVISALVLGIINRFFTKAKSQLAATSSLIRGGRTLSFQGRLTDNLGNSITTSTNVQFKLYKSKLGGSSLYTSGSCGIVPDQDGIFNVLIGQDCGAEIGSSVFTDNATIYLGVTVGSDSEMTPRTQIANVGYAINSEFLQGLAPGTDKSSIPYIDSTGTLLIAAASPVLRSSSGGFTIQGQALTLTTPSGSSGNISLTPDTGGNVYVPQGNLSIGTAVPGAKLSVGDNTFQVNSSGNLIKINNITYSWPGTQGAASTLLTNDGSGNLTWGTGGTTAGWVDDGTVVRLSTAGDKVSVGTTSNLAKLGVVGGADEIQLLVRGNSTQTTNLFSVQNSAATNLFTIGNSGNAALTGNLTVGNITSLNTVTYSWPSAQGAASTSLANDGAGTLSWTTTSAGGWLDDGVNVRLATSTDSVGIGTASPSNTLHVVGTERIETSNAGDGLLFYNGATQLGQFSQQATLDAATTILRLQGTSSKPLALGSSGTVLELQSAFQNTSNSTTSYRFNNSAGTGVLDIDTSNQRVGIGTTAPAATLDVAGAGNFSGLVTGTSGVTVTGAAINLNASSNFATNINTGTSTGAVSLGGGSGTVAISSTNWSITTAGDLTTAADIAVNGGDITTTSATFNIGVGGGGASTLNVGPAGATGTVNISGGSGDTGCSINGTNGNLTCAGVITSTASTGTVGYWTRSGTTLSPATSGDAVTTSGNISTSGTGTITSVGLLTGSAGITATGGAANINATGTNLTNIGNSTGALTLASGGTSVYSLASNTPNAFRFTDGTNTYQTIDTRTGTSGVSAFTFAPGTAPTIASAADASYITSTITPGTVNFTGTTGITGTSTSSNLGVLLNQLTLNGNNTNTITEASTLLINGAVKSTSSTGTQTITTSSALKIPAVSVNGTGGAVTNAYGLYLDAPTGATNNYAATFASGNVGIGTTAPSTFKLEVGGVIGPTVGSSFDMGSSARRWSTVWGDTGNFTTLQANNTSISGTTSSDFSINTDNATSDTEDATLTFERGTPATNAQFKWNSTTKQLSTNSPSFAVLPDSTISYSGTAAFLVNQIQDQDILTASSSASTKFVVAQNGDIKSVAGAKWRPLTDSTTALNISNAAGTSFVTYDTTNSRVGIGNSAPSTALDVTGVGTFSSSVAVNGGSLTTTATTGNLFNATATTLNLGGAATALNIGPTGSGASSVLILGGSGDTGCTLDGATGNLTCSGTVTTTNTSGTVGFWSRSNSTTTLSPSTAGDSVTTTGSISTTGSGTITSAGLLTGSAGITVTGGVANINATGTNLTNIGNSTGALTLSSGGTSAWTNTSGNLTIQTATSGTMTVDSVGAVNLGTTNATSVSVGRTGVTTTNNGALTSTQTLTASNGLTQTTGALNLTTTSGSIALTGFGTTAITSTTATGNILALADAALTTGTLASLSSTSTTQSSAKLINADHTATYTTTVTDSGNILSLNRALTTSTGGALTISGALASLTSNCTVSAGSCTDSSNILALTQSYASGSGDVLTITNSGAGRDISGTSNTWNISKAGSAVFVGVNSGSGLIQGTGGETVTGTVSTNTSGVGNTTIGNSAGGTITIGASSGSDLVLNDAQWSVTGGGAATFASLSTGSGAITGGAGTFTTLTSSGASTIGTGASLTNTFGSGASSINTIGSSTTPGALTLHGATTLDSTFTVSGSNLTSLGGNLTVTGSSWTATPTISGLITATSGLTSNGTLTVSGGQNLTLASGTGVFTQTHAVTTDATADANTITLSAGGTGSTGTLRGLVINQADTATTGVYDSLVYIGNQKTPETTTNGLFIEQNAASGTLTNAIQLTNTAGTLSTGINFTGTFGDLIIAPNFSVSNAGAVVAVGLNSGSGLIQGTGGITVTGTVNINTTNTSATSIGNTTGALTLASGGTSSWTNTSGNLTIQTATSGTMTIDSVAALALGTTNATSTALGKSGTTLTINPTSWTATPTISGLITATSGLTSNGTVTVSAGQNLTLASGTGTFTQTYTGTTTDAAAITANSLTTASAFKVTSTNNSGANTAWSADKFVVTNSQGTTAVSTGSIAGLDVQFTQNTSVAGNTETVARFNLAQNDSSSTDQTVASILDLGNNDTGTGNQITVTDGLKITGTNITNGINLSGTYGTNLITSSNFTVTQAGAITAVGVNSGSGLIQGTGGITVTGTANINATGTAATNIGNFAGALTLGSGGTSAWTNTSGNLTIETATSGNIVIRPVGTLDLSTTGGNSNITLAPNGTGAVVLTSGNAIGTTTSSSALSLVANSLTSGTGLNLSSTSTTLSSAKLLNIDHTAIYTTTVTDSGNLLNLNRALTTSTGGVLTISGALGNLTSNCTVSAGTCADTSNILALTQSYSSASGDVLSISNAGTGNAINISGSAARTINSTSATLTVKTTTSGSLNLTSAGTSTYTLPANTASAFSMTDGTTSYDLIDTRTTTNAVSATTISARAPTLTSASNSTFTTLTITPPTLTLTGTTTVSNQQDSVLINAGTITDSSAVTVSNASSFTVAGAPVKAGSVTLSNTYGIKVNAGAVSTATNAYGLYVDAPTGATNNYAAVFNTGNVGISTTAPSTKFHVVGASTLQGGAHLTALTTPSAPTVSVQGTTGSTTYGYKVTALSDNGETVPSSETTVTTGNATLTGSNFNRITWTAITGAVNYKVYRTTAGGTPSTKGLIGTVASTATLQLDDTGLSATTVPPDSTGFGGGSANLVVDNNILPNASPTAATASATFTSVDTTNDVGKYTSMKIGADGLPVLSEYDTTNGDLRVVKCGKSDCSSGNLITAVDTTGDVGQYSSLAIGTDGFPVISYYDVTNTDLKVTKCGNAACSSGNTTTTVHASVALDVGKYSSIAIGTDGFPVISYYDATAANLDLKVLKCGNTSCSASNTISSVETTNDVGQYSAIAIGTDGLPIISYYDNTNGDLRVAKCVKKDCSGTATITNVDSSSNFGQYTSIAIGADGLPVISEYDVTGANLRVVKCGNILCSASNTITAVDSTNDVGKYTSIAVGPDSLPIIFYYYVTGGDLRVLKCGKPDCSAGNTLTDLETTNDIGQYTSIAIGTDGIPVISYYDLTNGDLRVLKCADPGCINSGTGASTGGSYSGGSSIGNPGAFFYNVYSAYYWGKNYYVANFDLAEEYTAVDPGIEAGDVVKIAAQGGTNIEKTDKQYDNETLGVVSTSPGLTLSDWPTQDRKNMRPVALAGRVPVKVSTINGVISKGDHLTSSPIPGVAMKATKPGPIIGTALDGYSGEGVGKITVFVNTSWYDPDHDLTSTVDLHIEVSSFAKASEDKATPSAELVYNSQDTSNKIQTNSNDQIFKLINDKTGEAIDRIGAYAQVAVANIKAGFIDAKNIIAETITAKQITVREKLISPVVETSIIKPEPGRDLTIDLNNSLIRESVNSSTDSANFAKLIIKGFEGKTVASIDSTGAATFAGPVSAPEIKTQKLTADEIDSKTTEDLKEKLARLSSEASAERNDSVNSKIDLNAVQKLLADIKNQPISDTKSYQNIQDPVPNLQPNLNLTGNFYDLFASHSISVGNILMRDNSVTSLAGDLRFSALSTVSFFDGAVTIAHDGTITTRGSIIAKAIQADEGTFKAINISDKYLEASSSAGIIQTQGQTAGAGILTAGTTEVTINNEKVKENSLVYLTRTSPTFNLIPYITDKIGGAFKIKIDGLSTKDISFNWIFIN